MKKRLRQWVLGREEQRRRPLELAIQGIIVLSLVAFAVETLPGLSPATYALLGWVEILVVTVFTTEYLLRVAVAERRLAYIFSFYGLIDLLAVLPFYFTSDIALQTLRVLRLLGLLRILKLTRYSAALRRMGRAIALARDELALFGVMSLFLIYLAAVGIYHFEHPARPEVYASLFDCMWWAVVTLTTVGYGDIYPVTTGGRIFTFFILILGLGIVAVPTGIFASALAAVRKEEE